MKRILFLLLILSILRINAQHADLQQRWYVQNMTIDNVTTEIPTDPITFPFVYLDFWGGSSGYFETHNFQSDESCLIELTGQVTHTSTDVFEFDSFLSSVSTTACTVAMMDFMIPYISFFEDTVSEQFFYTITTETDGSKTLSITNDNNDTVVYTNSFFDPTPAEMGNTTWYLYNLIIDGENNFTPIFENEPTSGGCLAFFTDDGSAGCYFDGCWSMACRAYFDMTLEHFYLFIDTYTLSDCNNSDYSDYTFLYNAFFENSIYAAFSYSVGNNGETKSLVITSNNGDQAIYGDLALATQDYFTNNVSIFPNPILDILYIRNTTETIDKIEVSNILGEKVITKKTGFSQIDFTNNSAGVYLVKFYIGEAVLTRKVIKK